jgi:hypothetical protein
MNAYRVGHVCLHVRMILLENRWTDLDEIWYGRYANGDYRTFHCPTISNTNMADEQTCKVGSKLAPVAIGPCNDVWLSIFQKYKTLEK